MQLSAHFNQREFGGAVEPHLIEHLERLRTICGNRPLRIVSGLRTPEHNARVGGAKNSQHLYGRAADIPSGYATLGQARQAGFTGIGTSGGWATHVDVRPGPRTEWRYD